MKTNRYIQLITVATLGLLPSAVECAPSALTRCDPLVGQTFSLGSARSSNPQEFTSETRVVSFAPDGARGVTDIYRLRLRCVPAATGSSTGDSFTCLAFTVQLGPLAETEIPSLKGLTYVLDLSPENGKNGRPVLGVPHAPFEKLVDAIGRPVPLGNTYHVYNAFMDFHGFCSIYSHPIGAGAGIQDLTAIGQKIVHAASFTAGPVDLGSSVAEGSFFKHGEVTLEFKGISIFNGAACALLGVDSNQGSFTMVMRPAPDLEIKTTGSSHYKGDSYVNLV